MIEENVTMSTSDGASYNLHRLIVRAHTTAADLRAQPVTRDEGDAESDETSSQHALAESLSGDLSQDTLDFSSSDGFSSDDMQRSPSEHSEPTLTSPPDSLSFGQYSIATSPNFTPDSPASLTDSSNCEPNSHMSIPTSPANFTDAALTRRGTPPTGPFGSSSIGDAKATPTHTAASYAPVTHSNLDPSVTSLTSHAYGEGAGRGRGGTGPLRVRRERAPKSRLRSPPRPASERPSGTAQGGVRRRRRAGGPCT